MPPLGVPPGIFTGALQQVTTLLCPTRPCVDNEPGTPGWVAAQCTDQMRDEQMCVGGRRVCGEPAPLACKPRTRRRAPPLLPERSCPTASRLTRASCTVRRNQLYWSFYCRDTELASFLRRLVVGWVPALLINL